MSNKKNEDEKLEPQVSQEPQVKPYDPDELVDYIAPLLPGGKQQDIYGAVNGETFRVMRGVPVKIKRKFLDALMNAQSQQFDAFKAMQQMQKAGSVPAVEM